MPGLDFPLSFKPNQESIKKTAQELRKGLEDAINATSGISDKGVVSLRNQLIKAYDASKKLDASLTEIGNKEIPTEEYKNLGSILAKAADDVNANIGEMLKVVGGEESISAIQGYIEAVSELGTTAKTQKEFISGFDSLFDTFVSKLEGLKDEDALDFLPDLKKSKDAFDLIANKMQELDNAGKAFTLGKDTEEFNRKLEEAEQLNSKIRVLLMSVDEYNRKKSEVAQKKQDADDAQRAEEAGAKLQATTEKAKKAMQGLFATFSKGASRAVQKGLSLIGAKTKELAQEAKRAKAQFKSFVLAMLGVRSVSAIFSKLRQAFQEGFKYLEQYNGETIKFKDTIDSFKKTLIYLKNSLAVAFAPLVTAVVPYIQAAANALADLMTKIGAFFAMITGQSTMIVAKKQTEEYDKALKKAGGSAKKLRAELYGFDTLNKQQDNSGSGGDGSKMFEEVSVDSQLGQGVKDFIDTIKELWKNKDYFNLGATIAEKLNDGVKKLDGAIKRARVKLESGAKGLAQGLNGFVSMFKFDQFGTTIADGINTIFGTQNSFLKNFDFKNLGTGIGTGFDNMMKTVEWDSIGENLALKISGIFDFIDGFVSQGELFPNIANAITTTITSFVDNLRPEGLANAIVTVFNETAQYLAGVDWYDVLNIAFEWVLNIVDWLIDLLGELDWGAVGAWLARAWWDLQIWLFSPKRLVEVWGHVFAWIDQLLGGIVDFIIGILQGGFQGVADMFRSLGLDTIAGFFEGIVEKLQGVRDWLKKNVFDPIVNGVKELFGIASPSTVFADIGGFLIEGLKNGIMNMWNKVKDDISSTFEGLKKKVTDIFKIGSPSKVFEEYGEFIDMGFVNGIEGGKNGVEQAMDDMMSSIANPEATVTPDLNTNNLVLNLDGALARLSLIAEKFQQIGNVFAMVSNVPIPALATGGVVPPNAYGNQSYGQAIQNDGGLLNKIQDLIDRLESRPIEVHAHLELDGKEVYDSVVTENNNQISRTGSSRIRV